MKDTVIHRGGTRKLARPAPGSPAEHSTESIPSSLRDPGFGQKYSILEEVGRGASGTVYRAWDRERSQDVALKVFAPCSGDEAARFEREARLLARLDHPRVVRLLEVTTVGGRPCLVTEYLAGGSLRDRLRDRGHIGVAESLRLTRDILEGLEACHRAGLIHRDLKPENVLLDREGHARIADFGLARLAGGSRGSLTAPGTILGTPLYMAPEQLLGEDCTMATDLYQVGEIVFELLTGEPAHSGDSLVAILASKRRPVREILRPLAAPLPGELRACLTRCLEPEPARRPGSARELLATLSPDGETAPARAVLVPTQRHHPLPHPLPPGWHQEQTTKVAQPLAETRRISHRHPGPRPWKSVLVFVSMLGLAIGYRQAGEAAIRTGETPRPGAAVSRVIDSPSPARVIPVRPERPAPVEPPPVTAPTVEPPAPPSPEAARETTLSGTCQPNAPLRNLGDRQLGAGGILQDFLYDPATDSILTRDFDGFSLWNLRSWEREARFSFPLPSMQAASPRGKTFVTWSTLSREAPVRLALTDVARRTTRELDLGPGPLRGAAITDGGTRLAVLRDRERELQLLDPTSATVLSTRRLDDLDPTSFVETLELSADGSLLVVSVGEGRWRLFDVSGGTLERELPSPDPGPGRPVLSPGGERMAWLQTTGHLELRDPVRGRTLEVPALAGIRASAVAFSHDGRRLAVCGQTGAVLVLDLHTGRTVKSFDIDPYIVGIAFGPDDVTLLTGGSFGRIRKWMIDTGEERGPRGRTPVVGEVESVALSPDGRTAVVAGQDGDLAVWDAELGVCRGLLPDDEPRALRSDVRVRPDLLEFTPDGKHLLAGSAGQRNSLDVWDMATLKRVGRFQGHRLPITAVAVSSDGGLIASASRDGIIRLWDRQGNPGKTLDAATEQVATLSFVPGSRTLLSSGFQDQIDVWDTSTGRRSRQLVAPGAGCDLGGRDLSALSVSPDGRRVAAVLGGTTGGGRVLMWNLASGEVLRTWGGSDSATPYPLQGPRLLCTAFSPDSTRLAVGDDSGAVILFDTGTGAMTGSLHGHWAGVNALAWGPDNRRLLSGSRDGSAILWFHDPHRGTSPRSTALPAAAVRPPGRPASRYSPSPRSTAPPQRRPPQIGR